MFRQANDQLEHDVQDIISYMSSKNESTRANTDGYDKKMLNLSLIYQNSSRAMIRNLFIMLEKRLKSSGR